VTRPGYIYCLHFTAYIGDQDRPRARCLHYVGHARDVEKRIAEHLAGRGSALTRWAVQNGVGMLVSAVVPGSKAEERRIKNRKKLGGGICGACTVQPWEVAR
jgi:hypothetical protein